MNSYDREKIHKTPGETQADHYKLSNKTLMFERQLSCTATNSTLQYACVRASCKRIFSAAESVGAALFVVAYDVNKITKLFGGANRQTQDKLLRRF